MLTVDFIENYQNFVAKCLVGNGDFQAQHCPKQWQPFIQNSLPEKQTLTALALFSQARQLLVHNTPTHALTPLPLLAPPSLPLLDGALMTLAKRIGEQADFGVPLLHLLDTRGVMLPASVALPIIQKNTNNALPSVYNDWQNWLNNPNHTPHDFTDLTSDVWQEWTVGEKVSALKAYRQHAPQTACQLIADNVGAESAEHRLKLITTLAENLSEHDVPFLQTLLTDRSKKVVGLAKRFLAKLGVVNKNDENQDIAKELALEFEVRQVIGLPSKTKIVVKPTNNHKKAQLRTERLADVDLYAFADCLGVGFDDLLKYWYFDKKDNDDNTAFVQNAMNVCNDEQFELLLQRIIRYLKQDYYYGNQLFYNIKDRLTPAQIGDIAKRLFCDHTAHLEQILQMTDGQLPLTADELNKAQSYRQFMTYLKKQLAQNDNVIEPYARRNVWALGFLLPANLAESVYQELMTMGVSAFDDGVWVLELNRKLG